jgi:hypothetical protein
MAPHKPLPPVVLERMAQFSGNTRVKHDTLVAATIALEAGATHEMLDMVLSVSKPPSSVEDVGDMMEAFNVTVSDKVKRTLFSFSRTVCQKEDTKHERGTARRVLLATCGAAQDPDRKSLT